MHLPTGCQFYSFPAEPEEEDDDDAGDSGSKPLAIGYGTPTTGESTEGKEALGGSEAQEQDAKKKTSLGVADVVARGQ